MSARSSGVVVSRAATQWATCILSNRLLTMTCPPSLEELLVGRPGDRTDGSSMEALEVEPTKRPIFEGEPGSRTLQDLGPPRTWRTVGHRRTTWEVEVGDSGQNIAVQALMHVEAYRKAKDYNA